MDGRVIGPEPVLVAAIVDGDFDGDGGVDEANYGCGDADEIGVAAVGGAGEAAYAALDVVLKRGNEKG